jgi:hypothetical protein
MTSCVQGETLNSWQPIHHSEMKSVLFCLVSSDPTCTKACGQFKPWGIVAWASSVFGIPKSSRVRSTMICCCPCLHFPEATLNWKIFHTKKGHLPPDSSIDWLDCHNNMPGRSCLWRHPVPGDVLPLWHHNQVFSDRSHCVSPLAKHPPPHTSHFDASNS